MEFSEVQIARLILGYLKSKHYMCTFNKFLEECHHFDKTKQFIRSGEHYPTRVGGMSLVEFLEEYANLYTIVQARLEDTDYFNGGKRRSSLGIIDQLLYLFNTRTVHVSTPVSSVCSSEVEATSCDALPGNSQDNDNHLSQKITPKRKFIKTHSHSFNDNIDPAEVSGVLSQHLLDKTEFHLKLANTINIVRNSPEIINRQQQQQQNNEEIGAGASKELETLIKSVVEKTEEDPIYNQLIDEIMGIPTTDSTSSNQKSSISDSNTDDQYVIRRKQRLKSLSDGEMIDTQNYDAIRGIIEVSSQQIETPATTLITIEGTTAKTIETATTTTTTTSTTTNGGIYIYDGNLDYYLKNNATTSMINQNQLFIGTPGILVVPQINKQCDMINTEQIQQTNNKILTDSDIMAMPTIIINEEPVSPVTTTNVSIVPIENNQDQENNESITKITPKIKSGTSSLKNKKIIEETIVKSVEKSLETRSNPPRHVRNLDFTTPSKLIEIPLCTSVPPTPTTTTIPTTVTTTTPTTVTTTTPTTVTTTTPTAVTITTTPPTKTITTTPTTETTTTTTSENVNTTDTIQTTATKTTLSKAWDADLRMMIYGEEATKIDESSARKKKTRKKCNLRNAKDKDLDKCENEADEKVISLDDTDEDIEKQSVTPTNEQQKQQQQPADNKDKIEIVLDTPTKDSIPKTPGGNESLTPFSQVIEEHLHGIDIMSFPTPKVPVTPGFGLTTPLETNYQQRGTDYSTSSSYYMPSDNEQGNKSIEKAIDETQKTTSKVNIISDVVIDKETTKTTTIIEKFNRSLVGKKDLRLIELSDISSCPSDLSSSSDNEIDTVISIKSDDVKLEKTGEEIISDIIKKVEVQDILPDDHDDEQKSVQKELLKNLEEKRRRTIERMQIPVEKRPKRNQTKPKISSIPTRKQQSTTKCERNIVENKNKTKDIQIIRKIDDNQNNKNGDVDDEAKKLVQGLWERGICLIPNKQQIKPPQSIEIKTKESQTNLQIPSFQRYSCGDMIEMIHQDGFVAKKLNQYDLKRLEKKIEATVYIDDDDTPVTRNLICISFVQLLDIPSSSQKRCRRIGNVSKFTASSPMKTVRVLSPDDDKLMDCVAIGKISPELKTKITKKRKLKTSDNEKCTEKKSRKHENSIKLLRDINVDDFLDKVHNS